MPILLLFAFASGLITILAPCIWPLLPVVLSSSGTGGRLKPFGVTLGIMTSFTVVTLTISYLVRFLHFDPDILRFFAVAVLAFMGFTLAVPALTRLMEGWVAWATGLFGVTPRSNKSGFTGGFVIGASLGLVWAPCAGPILATIATLAATQSVNLQVVLVTLAYVVGIGIPLFLFANAGRALFTQNRRIAKYTPRIQQAFGVIMIVTALSIYTNYDKVVEAKLLDFVHSYSGLINQFEGHVRSQLDSLKSAPLAAKAPAPTPTTAAPKELTAADLRDMGAAPNFEGINQ